MDNLTSYLDVDSIVGGKMKETGTIPGQPNMELQRQWFHPLRAVIVAMMVISTI